MKIQRMLTTTDTHTAGGPTRTIVGGLPPLPGESVAEKMEYFRSHLDPVRKLLMCEPRGHKDMAGAVITEPTRPDADIGVFFLTSSGYLPACVHSSIGVATAGLETGFIQRAPDRPDGSIRMETPSGLVSLIPKIEGETVRSIAIRTPPAFVHTSSAELDIGRPRPLRVSLAFSGVFFVLLDVAQLEIPVGTKGSPIGPENVRELAVLGVQVLEEANRVFEVHHPENPSVDSLELVMIYDEVADRHARDVVISRSGGVDRSPCGAGTGAKVAYLFTEGKLGVGETYLNESFLGTQFLARVLEPAQVGPHPGAVPEIEGTACLTGMHQFVLDGDDPLTEGFLF